MPQPTKNLPHAYSTPLWASVRHLGARGTMAAPQGMYIHDYMTRCDRPWCFGGCSYALFRKSSRVVYLCAIVFAPWPDFSQVARWGPRGFRSFVRCSASERTLNSFSCSWWATEQLECGSRKNFGVSGELKDQSGNPIFPTEKRRGISRVFSRPKGVPATAAAVQGTPRVTYEVLLARCVTFHL